MNCRAYSIDYGEDKTHSFYVFNTVYKSYIITTASADFYERHYNEVLLLVFKGFNLTTDMRRGEWGREREKRRLISI